MRRFAECLAIATALLVLAGNDCKAQQVPSVAVLGVRAPQTSASDSVPVHSLTPKDTFLGPDKVKHFFMSAFIESVGFGGMQAVGGSRSASIGAATAVTVAAGVGREIHDKITKNLFSFGDLTWDAIGTGAALLLISHTQR
jgi:uncharacterized protein YfiM (DUF2279 family)